MTFKIYNKTLKYVKKSSFKPLNCNREKRTDSQAVVLPDKPKKYPIENGYKIYNSLHFFS